MSPVYTVRIVIGHSTYNCLVVPDIREPRNNILFKETYIHLYTAIEREWGLRGVPPSL